MGGSLIHKAAQWDSIDTPDSKVHGANMGPTWGRQDPGGPRVGPMNIAIWDISGLGHTKMLDGFYIQLVFWVT